MPRSQERCRYAGEQGNTMGRIKRCRSDQSRLILLKTLFQLEEALRKGRLSFLSDVSLNRVHRTSLYCEEVSQGETCCDTYFLDSTQPHRSSGICAIGAPNSFVPGGMRSGRSPGSSLARGHKFGTIPADSPFPESGARHPK